MKEVEREKGDKKREEKTLALVSCLQWAIADSASTLEEPLEYTAVSNLGMKKKVPFHVLSFPLVKVCLMGCELSENSKLCLQQWVPSNIAKKTLDRKLGVLDIPDQMAVKLHPTGSWYSSSGYNKGRYTQSTIYRYLIPAKNLPSLSLSTSRRKTLFDPSQKEDFDITGDHIYTFKS